MPSDSTCDWAAALAALDTARAPLEQAVRDLAAALPVDLESVFAGAREVAARSAALRACAAALATAAGEPEPTWADRTELVAALDALAARAAARADRGRERVLGLAAVLRAGRVVNKFTARTNARLDCLRDPAASELESAAEVAGLTFPGPDAGDWLEWAWARPDDFGALVDALRDRYPALCDLLDAIAPDVWVRGAPVPPAAAEPAPVGAEVKPEPAPVLPAPVEVGVKPGPAPVVSPVAPKPPPSGEKKINVSKLGWGQAQIPKGPRTFTAVPPPAPPPAPLAPAPAAVAPPPPPVLAPEPELEIPVAEPVEPEVELEPEPLQVELSPLPLELPPLPLELPPQPELVARAEPERPAPERPAPERPAPEPDEPPVRAADIENWCVRGEYLRAALLAFARETAGEPSEPDTPSGRAALVAHHALKGSPSAPWPDWCASAEAAHAAPANDKRLVFLAAQCQAANGGPDPLAADAAAALLAAFNEQPKARQWLDELAEVRAVPGLLERVRASGPVVDPRAEYAKHRAAFLEHAKRANKITDRGAYHNRQDQFLNRQDAGKRLLQLLNPPAPPGEVCGENRDIEAFLAQAPDEVTRQWLQSTSVTLNRNQPKVLAEAAALYLRLAAAAWRSARAVASQHGFNANVIGQHRAALDKLREPARDAARGRVWGPLFEKLLARLSAGGGT